MNPNPDPNPNPNPSLNPNPTPNPNPAPDPNPNPNPNQAAHEVLADERQRALYDLDLELRGTPRKPTPYQVQAG